MPRTPCASLYSSCLEEARGDAPSAPWLRLPKRNVPEDVALPDVPEEAYKGVYELLRKDWLGENELSQRAQWLSHLQEPKVHAHAARCPVTPHRYGRWWARPRR